MMRKYKITYNGNLEVEIEAYSKYDAKKRFYRQFPEAQIVRVEEVPDEQR